MGGFGFYLDPYYFLLVVPTFILAMIAQWKVKSTFTKYSRTSNQRGLTGAEVARIILERNNIYDVVVEPVGGTLTDHYDPRSKIARLSEPVYNSRSLAAVGVAAHEIGHAIQHATGYRPLKIKSTIYPLAGIGSNLGMPMAIFGLIFGLNFLTKIGIILFSFAVLVYIVTLPIEINASMRAISIIKQENILTQEEVKGARNVLIAAAMTYVASAAVAIANLLRLILLSRRND